MNSAPSVWEKPHPPIKTFNDALGITEQDFLSQCQGTIKLGIEFVNWSREGTRYMHAFGDIGRNVGLAGFHHYWLRARALGLADDFWHYSINQQAAINNRYTPLPTLSKHSLSQPDPGLPYRRGPIR